MSSAPRGAPRVLALLPLSLLLGGCTLLGGTVSASLDTATVHPSDQRSLTVQGLSGSCDTVQDPEVAETDDRVSITVPLRVESGSCNDAGVLLDVPARLDQPLGEREVVDASTGRALTVIGRDRCRVVEDVDERPAYFGLTPEQAEARAQADGFRAFRLTCRDGRELDRTSDYREDRLSAAVDDGRVTSTQIG